MLFADWPDWITLGGSAGRVAATGSLWQTAAATAECLLVWVAATWIGFRWFGYARTAATETGRRANRTAS